MKKTILDLLNSVPEIISERGQDYYDTGKIEILNKISPNICNAQVSGSNGEHYAVHVETDSIGNVVRYACDCPYDNNICKHLVAVFIAITDDNFCKKNLSASKGGVEIPLFLDKVPHEKLKKFVADYAEQNDKFKKELLVTFSEPDIDSEISEMKKQVRLAIQDEINSGYVDYEDCDRVCTECMDLLKFTEKRLYQGYFQISFSISLDIFLASLELTSITESDADDLFELSEYAFAVLEESCELADDRGTEIEKKDIYEKLLRESANEVFCEWDDWHYRLLKLAVQFVSHKNVKKMYDALESLSTQDNNSGVFSPEDDGFLRLTILEKLGDSEGAEKYLRDNLQFDRFREIAIDAALEREDFADAEQLCLERIESGEKYRLLEWLHRLYKIYEQSKDDVKRLQIAETLLLKNNVEYYDVLKTDYTALNSWEIEYPILLKKCAKQLSPWVYMTILNKEEEWALLKEQVELHPKEVFEYGQKLAVHYPDVIYPIFIRLIIEEAEAANDRSRYKRVCTSIKTLFDAKGTDEAFQLILEFQKKYYRRTAMRDELRTLQATLQRMKIDSKY